MRSLVKKEDLDAAPLDMAGAVREVTLLLHSDAVLRHVNVSLEAEPALPEVLGDRIQLQQVVLNLLLNAFDAMKDCHVSERAVASRSSATASSMLKVAVSDRGHGLSDGSLGPGIRCVLHHQAERARHGAFDQPIDRRGASRPPVGGEQSKPRRHVLLHRPAGAAMTASRIGHDADDAHGALIAIVDDDASVCRALERLVRSLGYAGETFSRGDDFLELSGEPSVFSPGLRGARHAHAGAQRPGSAAAAGAHGAAGDLHHGARWQTQCSGGPRSIAFSRASHMCAPERCVVANRGSNARMAGPENNAGSGATFHFSLPTTRHMSHEQP